MINYQSPTISLGTDVSFSLKLCFTGDTVTVYSTGESISRPMVTQDIDLSLIQDLSIHLRPKLSQQEFVPQYRLDIDGGRLVIDFPAYRQRLGDWSAIIRFTLPSSDHRDRQQHTATIPLCYVEDSSLITHQQQHYDIDAKVWAALRGPRGPQGLTGLSGPPGDTPRIVDGYWWIGERNTGVLAEAKRISADDWLLLNRLTTHKAIISDWDTMYHTHNYISPEVIIQEYNDRPNESHGTLIAKGHQPYDGSFTTTAMVIDNIQKYGDQLVATLEFESFDQGSVSIYWRGDDNRWKAARTNASDSNRKKLVAHIDGARGPIIVSISTGIAPIFIWSFDLYSPSDAHVATPQGTWLARNRAPKKGDTYLCTNIGTRGERILLAWDGHNWLTSWGGVIRGDTTNEAVQSYVDAIIALRKSIIDIPEQ